MPHYGTCFKCPHFSLLALSRCTNTVFAGGQILSPPCSNPSPRLWYDPPGRVLFPNRLCPWFMPLNSIKCVKKLNKSNIFQSQEPVCELHLTFAPHWGAYSHAPQFYIVKHLTFYPCTSLIVKVDYLSFLFQRIIPILLLPLPHPTLTPNVSLCYLILSLFISMSLSLAVPKKNLVEVKISIFQTFYC